MASASEEVYDDMLQGIPAGNESREDIDALELNLKFLCFEENKPEGCFELAKFYNQYKKDYGSAAVIYKKMCSDLGVAYGCTKYGQYLNNDLQDEEGALGYFKQGCKLGDPFSCHNAACIEYHKANETKPPNKDLLGQAYLDFELACYPEVTDQGVGQACWMIAASYKFGKNKPQDLNKYLEYGKRACRRACKEACETLAEDLKHGYLKKDRKT